MSNGVTKKVEREFIYAYSCAILFSETENFLEKTKRVHEARKFKIRNEMSAQNASCTGELFMHMSRSNIIGI